MLKKLFICSNGKVPSSFSESLTISWTTRLNLSEIVSSIQFWYSRSQSSIISHPKCVRRPIPFSFSPCKSRIKISLIFLRPVIKVSEPSSPKFPNGKLLISFSNCFLSRSSSDSIISKVCIRKWTRTEFALSPVSSTFSPKNSFPFNESIV